MAPRAAESACFRRFRTLPFTAYRNAPRLSAVFPELRQDPWIQWFHILVKLIQRLGAHNELPHLVLVRVDVRHDGSVAVSLGLGRRRARHFLLHGRLCPDDLGLQLIRLGRIVDRTEYQA